MIMAALIWSVAAAYTLSAGEVRPLSDDLGGSRASPMDLRSQQCAAKVNYIQCEDAHLA